MAWLSIMGMYNYNSDIFSGFRTPENVDRETTINTILLECAELELIYNNWDVMQNAIKFWTDKEFVIWQDLQATKEYEYNPIWNKDGTIEETVTKNLFYDKEGQGVQTKVDDFRDHRFTEEHNSNHGESKPVSNTTTESVKGFNSDTWAEAKKDVQDLGKVENDGAFDGAITDDLTHTTIKNEFTDSPDYHDHDHGTVTTTRVEKGNIGVTTTMQMIREQREVVQLDMIQYIVDSFKKRFCLLVY